MAPWPGPNAAEPAQHRFAERRAKEAGEDDENRGEIGRAADVAGDGHGEGRAHGARQQAQTEVAAQAHETRQSPGRSDRRAAPRQGAGEQHGPMAANERALLIDRDREGDGGGPEQSNQPMRAAGIIAVADMEGEGDRQQQCRRHDERRRPPVWRAAVDRLAELIKRDRRARPHHGQRDRVIPRHDQRAHGLRSKDKANRRSAP